MPGLGILLGGWRLLARLPAWTWPFLALLAFGGLQTVRLDGAQLGPWHVAGFKLGPIGMEGWKPKAKRLRGTIDKFAAAQKKARKDALAARAKQEARYRALAERTDHDIQLAKANAMARADRYIAAHRVRCAADTGAAGRADRAGQGAGAKGDHRPGAAAKLAPDLVAVSAADIRICTANTERLIAARKWGLAIAKNPSN